MDENDELWEDYKHYYLNNVFRPDLNVPPKRGFVRSLVDWTKKLVQTVNWRNVIIIIFLIYLVYRGFSYFCSKRGPKKRRCAALFNIPCWSLERIERQFNYLKVPGQQYHQGQWFEYDPTEEEITLIREIEQMLREEKKPED